MVQTKIKYLVALCVVSTLYFLYNVHLTDRNRRSVVLSGKGSHQHIYNQYVRQREEYEPVGHLKYPETVLTNLTSLINATNQYNYNQHDRKREEEIVTRLKYPVKVLQNLTGLKHVTNQYNDNQHDRKREKEVATRLKYPVKVLTNMTSLINVTNQYNDNQHDRQREEEVVTRLKYPVKMLPNLTSLINATNPKFPLTINAPYLIENPELCRSVHNLSVLVVVNSATNNFDRRQAIRETWTNDTSYRHLGTVRVLFLLGVSRNKTTQGMIEKEFQQHRDILQGDFIDAYFNLTHKGVMGFKWLKERCRNPKHILKVDDDILVNMFIYFQKIQHVQSVRKANVYCDYRPTPVFRDKRIKWYVDEDQFKGVKHYLNFCRGKFVSMTNDILPSLYMSASKTPFFKLDDVLLFGYVMHNVPGLKYQKLKTVDMQANNTAAMQCLKKSKDNCPNFVIQAGGRKKLTDTWSAIVKYFRS